MKTGHRKAAKLSAAKYRECLAMTMDGISDVFDEVVKTTSYARKRTRRNGAASLADICSCCCCCCCCSFVCVFALVYCVKRKRLLFFLQFDYRRSGAASSVDICCTLKKSLMKLFFSDRLSGQNRLKRSELADCFSFQNYNKLCLTN